MNDLQEMSPSRDSKQLVAERGKIYGDYAGTAALACTLKTAIRNHNNPGNYNLLSSVEQEALDHICTKIARIRNRPLADHRGSWEDIEGYARCVLDAI